MYAVFENKGTLDMRALTVMGVNAKPKTTTPIGYFGTGLKYAMAILTRMGACVYVQPGDGTEYVVKSRRSEFRDKHFEFLYLEGLNDQELALPFTTELGKNWELWQVVRELECNTRDENGEFIMLRNHPIPEEGTVRFIVTDKDILSMTANIDDQYISLEKIVNTFGDPIATQINKLRNTVFFDMIPDKVHELTNEVQAIEIQSGAIYLNKVLTGASPKKNAFIYNLNARLSLTEDRSLQYMSQAESRISDGVLKSTDTYVLRRILACGETVSEWNWFADGIYGPSISEPCKEVLLDWFLSGRKMSQNLTKLCRGLKVEKEIHTDAEMFDTEKEMLDEAIMILGQYGYPVDKFKIKFVTDLGEGILGRADQDKQIIYISRFSFEQGLENVMGTLIEEYSHIEYSFWDGDRNMQDWLLRQIVVQIQKSRRMARVLGRRTTDTTGPNTVDRPTNESHSGSIPDSTD